MASKQTEDKQEFSGSMCGDVVKASEFLKDPMGSMMAFRMPDKQFDKYVRARNAGDTKKAKEIFDKYAMSAI